MKLEMGGDKLQQVSGQIIDVMRKAELKPDEVLNILINILARSSIITCVEKKEIVGGLALAYDMHLSQENNNETLN
jgi:hypothetical protein